MRYERFIKGLEIDGFEVLGYARKSPHNLSIQALKNNLQNMVDYLRNRSLVDSVHVSPKSTANSVILSRDMSNTGEELTKMNLDHCADSTQSKLF